MTLATTGAPIDRETIRSTTEGFLVTCGADLGRCGWQGLFDDRDLAVDALNNHVARERRKPGWSSHTGQVTAHLVELLDDTTARASTEGHHVFAGQAGPPDPFSFPEPEHVDSVAVSEYVHDLNGTADSPPFPIEPADGPTVGDVVARGDLIDPHGPTEGKVYTVSETRTLGLPAWSVTYVAPEAPFPDEKHGGDPKYLNELVAVDGVPTCRYGENCQHPVVGRADGFQATIV